ncbi:MAG TPA: HAMP domain-containing sensor histidine kinase [Chitinophagaceae bacterium]|nr:HAMP domain-containing sensor histidine kinase [Chitinophagaceae bacterium]
MELSQYRLHHLLGKLKTPRISRSNISLKQYLVSLMREIKKIGYSETMEEYELRKLGIFNQLNFFQLLSGIVIFFTCIFYNDKFGGWIGIVSCVPLLVSMLVLYLNSQYKHKSALIAYFILHPLAASFIFMNGMHLGIDLYFILYGILAVFFLKDRAFMVFTIAFSMVNFFVLSVVLNQFLYQLENINEVLYLINEGVAIVFIFYGLYLVKNENTIYQLSILDKNNALQQKNVQIQIQSEKILKDASLLEKQTEELTELNALKNKLFGIISHDLKAPMYALRNFFSEIQQNNISARELKNMIPAVVNDLTYTTSLMDNLLQWSKAQMQSNGVYPQRVDIPKSIEETLQLLRRQSETKRITIESESKEGVFGFMDKDMLNLVLRNLISNAIKFTPEKGTIKIGVHENCTLVEVFVQDTGTGISPEALKKISSNDFYSTKGTANESGTGLGLKLCKEFMVRNGGQLYIESKPGKGSIFSFSLPKAS